MCACVSVRSRAAAVYVCLTSHIGFSLLQMKSQMLAQLQQQQQRQQQQQLFMPFSNFVVITVAATDVSHAKY